MDDITPNIHINQLNYNLLWSAKTEYRYRKMWKFFFILPVYPICKKKVFISPILRCFMEK